MLTRLARPLAALAVLCGGLTLTATLAPAATPPHVLVIVMENHSYSQIIGNTNAPYENQLAADYATATASYATTHPSLPNYMDLVSGSTDGISTDCTTRGCASTTAKTIVDQLSHAGISWRAYMETLPSACYLGGDTATYVRRHDPFVYVNHIENSSTKCHRIVPASQMLTNLNSTSPPSFAWLTPNVCHDMHTCSIATGDKWLSTEIPKIQGTAWWKAGGVILLTYDEGKATTTQNGGGHIATFILAEGYNSAGDQLSTFIDQVGVLRSVEKLYGLPYLKRAATPKNGTLTSEVAPVAPVRLASSTTPTPIKTPVLTTASNCGRYWANGGFYLRQTRCWGDTAKGAVRLFADSYHDWGVTASMKVGGAISAYPDVDKTYTGAPPALSSFPKITSTFTERQPTAAINFDAEAAYDVWLNPTTANPWNGATELMVWVTNHRTRFGNHPTGALVGKYKQPTGHTWHVYRTATSGEIGYVQFANHTHETVNLLDLFKHAQTLGYLSAATHLVQLNFGWELATTAGSHTWRVYAYSLTT